MKLLISHSALPRTYPYLQPCTLSHMHTHIHSPNMYTHILKMPISAEQWRVSVGAINASRRPCQSNKRWMCWEVFLLLLTALLVSTLLPGGGWRSRSEDMNISHIWPEIPEQRQSYTVAFNAVVCAGYYTTKLPVCSYSLYV